MLACGLLSQEPIEPFRTCSTLGGLSVSASLERAAFVVFRLVLRETGNRAARERARAIRYGGGQRGRGYAGSIRPADALADPDRRRDVDARDRAGSGRGAA